MLETKKLIIHRNYRAAEDLYQKALLVASSNKDVRSQAVFMGKNCQFETDDGKGLIPPGAHKVHPTSTLSKLKI